jgi:anti-sigma factor RsiW
VKGNMMKCETIREQIFEATPSAEVKAHLASCPECARVWKAMQSTMNLLDEWKQPEASPFFDAKLRARLQQVKAEEAAAAQGWFAFLRKPAFGMPVWRPLAAGVMVVVFAVGFGVMNSNVPQPNNAPVISAQGVHVADDVQILVENENALSNLDLLDDLAAGHEAAAPDSPDEI